MKLSEIVERQRAWEQENQDKLAGKTAKQRPVGVVLAQTVHQQEAKESTALGDEVENETATKAANEELDKVLGAHPQLVYVDQIDLDESQPRHIQAVPTSEEIASFKTNQEETGVDPGGLKALARSIYIHGLLSPLVVDRHRGRFRLVAGERRYWAVRLLGWKQVPAVIWGQLSGVHRLALQVTENLQREDLSQQEKKAVFERIALELEGNVSEACRLLSVSRTTWYRVVGQEHGDKTPKRVSSGQLVKVLLQMKAKVPNMALADQAKVLLAVRELYLWLEDVVGQETATVGIEDDANGSGRG